MLYMHKTIHHRRDGTVTVRRWFSQNGKPRRKMRWDDHKMQWVPTCQRKKKAAPAEDVIRYVILKRMLNSNWSEKPKLQLVFEKEGGTCRG